MEIFRKAWRIADGEAMRQVRARVVEHQHTKKFVVDVALDENGGVRQHFIEIERGVDLFADLRERRQDFRRHLELLRAGLCL